MVIATPGEERVERSEEFEVISSPLQEMRAAIRKLSACMAELDERRRD